MPRTNAHTMKFAGKNLKPDVTLPESPKLSQRTAKLDVGRFKFIPAPGIF